MRKKHYNNIISVRMLIKHCVLGTRRSLLYNKLCVSGDVMFKKTGLRIRLKH